MDISVKRGAPQKEKTPCIIAGVFAGKRLSDCAQALDKTSRQTISKVLKRGDISGKPGEWLLLPEIGRIAADRVLLIGCGKPTGVSPAEYRKIIVKAAEAIVASGVRSATSVLTEIKVHNCDLDWKVREQVLAFSAASYRFDQLKSKPPKTKVHLNRIGLLAGPEQASAMQLSIRTAQAIANGIRLTKDLANLPGNHCPPAHLAGQARELAKTFPAIKTTVLEEADMKKLGMGSLLSVARGSRQPAKLITMEYYGGADETRPVVLVGKGVTFDAGGISIKPAAAMDEMKYDMSGAASVLGILSAVAELELPINVVGVIPATENLPDGDANKPGDIVTSMSGQTIEILNTDAEGRLILCDALTYCDRFKPDVVIDVATLTGACVVALGNHASGLMSNDDDLAQSLLKAGETSGDRAWRLPLWDDYQKQIDSPFADMANVGGRNAGTITAACFLLRFAKNYKWAHIDIAGTAWLTGNNKGATGRPVPLLMEFILGRCANDAE